jgi:hypothetical protein
MATGNTALRVTELDFISIKENLKEFLRSQSTFSDYDFEGSGMSVLLDVLAYNTYYNSFYLNMVANEAFLDTAQVRQNILSHAKHINYVPMSRRGAFANVNVKVTPSTSENQTVQYIVMDRYTQLLGTDIDGVNHPFVTINANAAGKVAGSFNFEGIRIKQGQVITQQYPVLANNSSRRFQIPSANIDTSTITVTVLESSSNNYTEEYKLSEDLTVVEANSRVFFLEEDDSLNYTLYFGDNVIGKRPANGNIVQVTYLDTVGSAANSITRFTFSESVGGLFSDNVIVTTVSASYGGTDKETEEQIRFRAPQHYVTQNRAVTKNDYEAIITRGFNNIDSVSIWGGDENDPPVFGKVYMSLKTKGLYALSNLEKESIKNKLILERNVLTVIPEIVDPDYTFVMISGKVVYNPTLTSKTENQLIQIVRNAVSDYNEKEINKFNSTFRKARLQKYIEACDPSITGSDIDVLLQKQITLQIEKATNYQVKFNAPISKSSFYNRLYSFPQIHVYDLQNVLREVLFEEIPNSFTGVDYIGVLNPGRNFSGTPTVTITGDGEGATATAKVVNGRISRIDIVNKGQGYTRATVTISGGGGTEATAFAKFEARYGVLRTYYYKPNGEKVIVNEKAGTVDHLSGLVTLDSLYTIGTDINDFYAEGILTVNVAPEEEIILPLRNRILAIDTNNPQSIQIQMVPET